MKVLYHIKPYFGCISPYIAVAHRPLYTASFQLAKIESTPEMDATKTPDIDNKHRDDNDRDSSDSSKTVW